MKRLVLAAVMLGFSLSSGCSSNPASSQLPTPPASASNATHCSEFESFSDSYDALANTEQPVVAAAESAVDAHRNSLTQYHAAWKALAATLTDFATKVRDLSQPPALVDDIEAIASAIDAQAALAVQFAGMAPAAIQANFYLYTHAAGVRDGAITRMSFDLGLQKGLAGCD